MFMHKNSCRLVQWMDCSGSLIVQYVMVVILQDLTALVADLGLARMFHPMERRETNKTNDRARGCRRRYCMYIETVNLQCHYIVRFCA